MAKTDQNGQEGAHPRGDGGSSAAQAAEAAPAAELPGADPLDLVDGLPDGDGNDALALVAEMVASPARARGRPPGAANKRSGDMIRYLQARGHRDPMVTLSMIQSADFGALCRIIGADSAKQRAAVLAIQRAAASDLMPYFHSRKPQQLELPDGGGSSRPVMVFGDLNVSVETDADFWRLGATIEDEKANEINGEAVRLPDGSRTD